MKFKDYEIPDALLYTKEHEWAGGSGGTVRIGVTDYAAKTLNDVVYVTLPKVGAQVAQFKSVGTVESIKAVSEVYTPLSGTVTAVNEALNAHPELVNKEPYGDGWLLEIRPTDLGSESRGLLDAQGYLRHLEATAHKE
ncbi:MAG TPA: glycine cleavage system protein GcvH [Nitrososphaerales archaeon]|nr:glycine cleavage system protein GcvH [Nitrososphaerales archaeon]